MTDVPTLLAGIKTRAEKATPGSWEIKEDCRDYPSVWHDQEVAFSIGRCADCGVEAEYEAEDAAFIAAARTDIPRLAAAIEAAAGLHKPETRWMPYDGAEVSYDTREEAIEACEDLDIGIAATVLVPFDLCAHCKTIEEGPCDGECTREMGYRESLWPCPTITAVVAALEGEGA